MFHLSGLGTVALSNNFNDAFANICSYRVLSAFIILQAVICRSLAAGQSVWDL